MDALLAQADAIRPVQKRERPGQRPGRPSFKGKGKEKSGKENEAGSSKTTPDDPTLISIKASTALPRSLRPSSPAPGEEAAKKKFSHIKNKDLRLQLDRKAEHNARSRAMREDAALLTEAIGADGGQLEAEGALEKTWRLSQTEIVNEVGMEAAKGRREWTLDGGPYRSRYTRNGRYVALTCFILRSRLIDIPDIWASLERTAM